MVFSLHSNSTMKASLELLWYCDIMHAPYNLDIHTRLELMNYAYHFNIKHEGWDFHWMTTLNSPCLTVKFLKN